MIPDHALARDLVAGIPGVERQMSWIDDVVGLGVRRPGTDENARTVEWCADILAALGYEIELQPVRALTSHPGRARVTAVPCGDRDGHRAFHGMAMPFTTPVGAARFRLARRSDGGEYDATIALLEHVRLTELPTTLLDEQILARHDPTDEFAHHVHVLPFGAALGKEIDGVVSTGAGAMIGVVDAPWTTCDYFVPYDGLVRPIPALWLDREQGAELDAMLTAGPVEIEIDTVVEHRERVDHNVIATAPGPDRDTGGDAGTDSDADWIVIGSHHDAPWASAVEDASGIAQVLAQATAWSTIAPERRPASLAFLLTAAHMSEGAGTREFIASWRHRDRIRLALHLEHLAVEAEPDGHGGLRPSDRPEIRWWFSSAPDPVVQTAMIEVLAQVIANEDLVRSMVLPAEAFGPMPPTDGGFFHLADIPMVNLLAAPMYLFDPCDTPRMVHRESLVPTSRAALALTLAAAGGWRTDHHESTDR